MEIKIFLFHRVSPDNDFLWNPMKPELFEQIVAYLSKRYEIVPLEKTLLGEYKPTSKKTLCAITFDDGYKDFIEYAFPILQKYKSPSSMYVVTDCVDENIPPWTFIVNHLFTNTSKSSINLDLSVYPADLQSRKWTSKEERMMFAKKLSPFLKKINYDEKTLIYDQIRNEFNDVDLPLGMMMSWTEIKQVYDNGCEIGSHSVSHPLLANKTDSSKIKFELAESGKRIQTQIGKFPLAISYPFGSCNDTVIKIAQETGYKTGLAVSPNSYNSNVHNLFKVPRIELYQEHFFKSKLRIMGVIEKINRLIKVLLITAFYQI